MKKLLLLIFLIIGCKKDDVKPDEKKCSTLENKGSSFVEVFFIDGSKAYARPGSSITSCKMSRAVCLDYVGCEYYINGELKTR